MRAAAGALLVVALAQLPSSSAVPLDRRSPAAVGGAAVPVLAQGEATAALHSDVQGGLVRREALGASEQKPEMTMPEYKMELNKVVQSSPDKINLDGDWTTASGMRITVKGNAVLGPDGSGYRETLDVQNGGRRVEMHVRDEHVTYWAVLNGRGSLNWNDGDVWFRKKDCIWQPWSLFGACGGPCPQGMQQRRRGFEFLQENGGNPCHGPKEECRESSFCPKADLAQVAGRMHTSDLGFDSTRPQEELDKEAAKAQKAHSHHSLLSEGSAPSKSAAERSPVLAATAVSLAVAAASKFIGV